jgi:DNA repair exonuclease SbcCD ATPase subunit
MLSSDDANHSDPCGSHNGDDLGHLMQIQKENLSLATTNAELSRQLDTLRRSTADSHQLKLRLRASKEDVRDLKARLQTSDDRLRETTTQLTMAELRCKTEFASEANALTTRIRHLESTVSQLEQSLHCSEAALQEAGERYNVDLAYIQNQDRLLLSAASSHFGRACDTIEELRNRLLTGPPTPPPANPPLHFDQIKAQYQTIKRKYRQMQRTQETEIAALKSQHEFEVEKLKQTIAQHAETIQELEKNHRAEIRHLKSQIPQKKRLYKFTAPTFTIAPPIPIPIPIPARPHSAKRKVEPSVQVVDQLKSSIDSLTNDNRRLRASLDAEIEKGRYAEDQNQKAREQYTETEAQLRQQVSSLEAANEDLNNKYKKLGRGMRAKIMEEKQTIEKLQNQIQELSELLSDSKMRESEQAVSIARLQAQINLNRSTEPVRERLADIVPALEPTPNWADIAGSAPLDLQIQIRPILTNSGISVSARFELTIRKLCVLWSEVSDELKAAKNENAAIRDFVREVTDAVVGKPIAFESIAADRGLRHTLLKQMAGVPDRGESHQWKRKVRSLHQKLRDASTALRESEMNVDIKQSEIDALQSQNARMSNELRSSQEDRRSADDYEELVHQLRRRCREQKKTIESLTG